MLANADSAPPTRLLGAHPLVATGTRPALHSGAMQTQQHGHQGQQEERAALHCGCRRMRRARASECSGE